MSDFEFKKLSSLNVAGCCISFLVVGIVAFASFGYDNLEAAESKQSAKKSSPAKPASKIRQLSTKELATLQKKIAKHDHLQVDFKSWTPKNLQPEKHRPADGRLFFKRPNMFRWTVATFPGKDIFFNPDGIFILNSNLGGALKIGSGDVQSQQITKIISLITDVDSLTKEYKVDSAHQGESILKLQLLPKNTQQFKRIFVSLDYKIGYVTEVKMHRSKKVFLRYVFSNPTFSEIDKKVFYLKPGTKISDQI